jgi:hypothetical protein
MIKRLVFSIVLLFSGLLYSEGATRYVDVNNTTPSPPYLNWMGAATNIQDALDEAVDGDTIMIAEGVYNTGGSRYTNFADEVTYNRIIIDKQNISLVGYGINSNIIIEGATSPADTVPSTRLRGGGVINATYNVHGWQLSGYVFTNCIFINNGSYEWGLFYAGSTVYDSLISENYGSTDIYGILFNWDPVHLYNTIIEKNNVFTKPMYGYQHQYITNCIYRYNSAGSLILGRIYNSHIHHNTNTYSGGYIIYQNSTEAKNNVIENNSGSFILSGAKSFRNNYVANNSSMHHLIHSAGIATNFKVR